MTRGGFRVALSGILPSAPCPRWHGLPAREVVLAVIVLSAPWWTAASVAEAPEPTETAAAVAAPAASEPAAQDPRSGQVLVLEVTGTIDPAIADYLVSNIDRASVGMYEAVIIELDTPGGLETSMREIIKAILASNVPVVTFVYPQGAIAASAGTIITIAGNVAAMAPGTTIGAATPVGMGGEGMDKTMEKKAVNISAEYARSLAQLRGRNADWAEKAVREAAPLGPDEAVKQNVVDFTATDLPDLLRKLDGRKVSLGGGTLTLGTLGAAVARQEPSWIQGFLHALAHPEVAYILLMLGIWGLYFELANPGMVLPGVIGGVCLILGMYGLYILPTNLAGILLIILAAVLFVVDLFAPTHGALTIGGIVSFVLGSLMLFPSSSPFGPVPWHLILIMSVLTAGFFAGVMFLVVRAQRSRVVMGVERLTGMLGRAKTTLAPAGVVLVEGEEWSARSVAGPVAAGEPIEIIKVEGLTLKVRRAGGGLGTT